MKKRIAEQLSYLYRQEMHSAGVDMTDLYNRLKKEYCFGYWGSRTFAELQYMMEISRAGNGECNDRIGEALREAECFAKEHGSITKECCLSMEERLSGLSAEAKSLTVLLIAHAHLDMNWMWGFNETVSIVINTIETMLDLLDRYPQFIFSQSQASVYRIVETYAPDLIVRIRDKIREGRWEVTASTWVENDKNMSGTEAMARHILYTKEYLAKLLEIDPAVLNIDFEPDTFGHSGHIPEILAQGGVKYYYHCRGYDGEHIYRWRSPSGQELLVYREPVWYNDHLSSFDSLSFVPSFCSKYGIRTAMKFYGVGDHGGGPTAQQIERWMDMQSWPLMPDIRFGSLRDFFASLEASREQFPVIDQELNYIFTGCYTTQSRIKRGNRLCEARLADAEAIQTVTDCFLPGLLPAIPLKEAWIRILFNQFHDILPGSGTADSHPYALGEYQKAMACAQTMIDRRLRALAAGINTCSLLTYRREADGTPASGKEINNGTGVGFGTGDEDGFLTAFSSGAGGTRRAVIVMNPAGYERSECVRFCLWDWPGDPEGIVVVDSDQQETEVQLLEKDVSYWDHSYHSILIHVTVPAFGYATYLLDERKLMHRDICWAELSPSSGQDPRKDEFSDAPILMENESVCVRFDPLSMELLSFTDRDSGLEMVSKGAGAFYFARENPVNGMEAWRIGPFEQIVNLNETCPVRILSYTKGELVRKIRYEMKFSSSSLQVEISLKKESRLLEYACTLDWHEIGSREKGIPNLGFRVPASFDVPVYRCAVPGGVTDRSSAAHDVPCIGSMTAIREGDSGLSVFSDCKYGFRGYNNTICVALERAAYYPDSAPDQGKHTFRLLLGRTVSRSDAASQYLKIMHPLYPVSAGIHPGTLPLTGNLLTVTGPAEVTAMKRSEDRKGIVLRLRNTEAKENLVGIKTESIRIGRAYYSDYFEREGEEISVENGTVTALLPPSSIRTIKLITE